MSNEKDYDFKLGSLEDILPILEKLEPLQILASITIQQEYLLVACKDDGFDTVAQTLMGSLQKTIANSRFVRSQQEGEVQ